MDIKQRKIKRKKTKNNQGRKVEGVRVVSFTWYTVYNVLKQYKQKISRQLTRNNNKS